MGVFATFVLAFIKQGMFVLLLLLWACFLNK